MYRPGVFKVNWARAGPSTEEPSALLLLHAFACPASAPSDDGIGPGQQFLRHVTYLSRRHTAAGSDEIMQLVFPGLGVANEPSPVVALAPPVNILDSFFRSWTEVCCGTSDGRGGVAWGPPMTPEQLGSAPLTVRDAVQTARKLQFVTGLDGCIHERWFGGVLALAPSARSYLPGEGCQALDALVSRKRRLAVLSSPKST